MSSVVTRLAAYRPQPRPAVRHATQAEREAFHRGVLHAQRMAGEGRPIVETLPVPRGTTGRDSTLGLIAGIAMVVGLIALTGWWPSW